MKWFRDMEKLFQAAEVAKFDTKEREKYEESLKYYRDIKNVVDTARDEGVEEGIKQRSLEIAQEMKHSGMDTATIMKLTGLSADEINAL